jgi:glutathione S-transferase
MQLYGHPQSSCTRKVLITLAEKRTEAEFCPIDLFTGENKKATHLARHPFGVVPVLDDDGFILFESRAIIRYLDARMGATSLTPGPLREVARMNQWLSVDQSFVAPHTRVLAIERVVRKHEGLVPDADTVAAAETALARAFAVIDGALGHSTYLAGETFSLADVSLMPYVASLPMIGAERLLRGLPRLGAWWARVRDRASWRHVMACSEQIPRDVYSSE